MLLAAAMTSIANDCKALFAIVCDDGSKTETTILRGYYGPRARAEAQAPAHASDPTGRAHGAKFCTRETPVAFTVRRVFRGVSGHATGAGEGNLLHIPAALKPAENRGLVIVRDRLCYSLVRNSMRRGRGHLAPRCDVHRTPCFTTMPCLTCASWRVVPQRLDCKDAGLDGHPKRGI